MSTLCLRLIRFSAICENGHPVIFHGFWDMEYARLLVRTKKSEQAIAIINDLLEEASQIVRDLICETGIPDKGDECFQAVIGTIFDKSPLGEQYHLSEIFCPICGSSKLFKRQPVYPEVIEETKADEVSYNTWKALTYQEKVEQLKQALKEIGCY